MIFYFFHFPSEALCLLAPPFLTSLLKNDCRARASFKPYQKHVLTYQSLGSWQAVQKLLLTLTSWSFGWESSAGQWYCRNGQPVITISTCSYKSLKQFRIHKVVGRDYY